jgi:hypothetical protein
MSNEEVGLVLGMMDDTIPLGETSSIFDRIDRVIDKAILDKNGWRAINLCLEIYQVARLSSISFAKALYETVANWDKFGIDEDVIAVLVDKLGVHRNTVNRYVSAWTVIQSGVIPKEHTEKVVGRGIADIIKITKMLDGGYEPTEEQWQDIVDAPCRTDLEEAIRDVTHEPVSERVIYPVMEIDGTINVWHKGEKHYVGKLDTSSGVFAVQKTIYRMAIGGGVTRK